MVAVMDDARLDRLQRAQQEFFSNMRRIAEKHELSPVELLAFSSFATGALIAWQDPNEIALPNAIALVNANVEAGARSAASEIARLVARGPIQ